MAERRQYGPVPHGKVQVPLKQRLTSPLWATPAGDFMGLVFILVCACLNPWTCTAQALLLVVAAHYCLLSFLRLWRGRGRSSRLKSWQRLGLALLGVLTLWATYVAGDVLWFGTPFFSLVKLVDLRGFALAGAAFVFINLAVSNKLSAPEMLRRYLFPRGGASYLLYFVSRVAAFPVSVLAVVVLSALLSTEGWRSACIATQLYRQLSERGISTCSPELRQVSQSAWAGIEDLDLSESQVQGLVDHLVTIVGGIDDRQQRATVLNMLLAPLHGGKPSTCAQLPWEPLSFSRRDMDLPKILALGVYGSLFAQVGKLAEASSDDNAPLVKVQQEQWSEIIRGERQLAAVASAWVRQTGFCQGRELGLLQQPEALRQSMLCSDSAAQAAASYRAWLSSHVAAPGGAADRLVLIPTGSRRVELQVQHNDELKGQKMPDLPGELVLSPCRLSGMLAGTDSDPSRRREVHLWSLDDQLNPIWAGVVVAREHPDSYVYQCRRGSRSYGGLHGCSQTRFGLWLRRDNGNLVLSQVWSAVGRNQDRDDCSGAADKIGLDRGSIVQRINEMSAASILQQMSSRGARCIGEEQPVDCFVAWNTGQVELTLANGTRVTVPRLGGRFPSTTLVAGLNFYINAQALGRGQGSAPADGFSCDTSLRDVGLFQPPTMNAAYDWHLPTRREQEFIKNDLGLDASVAGDLNQLWRGMCILAPLPVLQVSAATRQGGW